MVPPRSDADRSSSLGEMLALLTSSSRRQQFFTVAGSITRPATGSSGSPAPSGYTQHPDVVHDAPRGRGRAPVNPAPVAAAVGRNRSRPPAPDQLLPESTPSGLDLPSPVATALASLRDNRRRRAPRRAAGRRRAPGPRAASRRRLRIPRPLRSVDRAARRDRDADGAPEPVRPSQTRHERVIAMVLVAARRLRSAAGRCCSPCTAAPGSWTTRSAARRSSGPSPSSCQQSLLPSRLPCVPGLRLAARSRPGTPPTRSAETGTDVLACPREGSGWSSGTSSGTMSPLPPRGAAPGRAAVGRCVRVVTRRGARPVNDIADIYDVTELTTCLYAVFDPGTPHGYLGDPGHLDP